MDLAHALTADEVNRTLREHEAGLWKAGVKRLALFRPVARGDARPASDIDLVAEIDRTIGFSLLDLIGLEQELGDRFGRSVQILTEPIRKERPRVNVARDRVQSEDPA